MPPAVVSSPLMKTNLPNPRTSLNALIATGFLVLTTASATSRFFNTAASYSITSRAMEFILFLMVSILQVVS